MRAIKTTTISILAVGLLAGSVIGVAAQDEASTEAAEVTGRAVQARDIETPGANMEENADGIVVGDDFVSEQSWNTSDPRLNGRFTRTTNFRFDPDSGNSIASGTYELTNDGGSWLGDGREYTVDALGDARSSAAFVTLDGRDGYEGLSAFVVFESVPEVATAAWDLNGIIFPSERPEVPEPYAAE